MFPPPAHPLFSRARGDPCERRRGFLFLGPWMLRSYYKTIENRSVLVPVGSTAVVMMVATARFGAPWIPTLRLTIRTPRFARQAEVVGQRGTKRRLTSKTPDLLSAPSQIEWPIEPFGSFFANARADLPSLSAPCLSETRIVRDYRLLAELGRGSYGTVYKAVETTTGMPYAVKLCKEERLTSELRWSEVYVAHLCKECPQILKIHDAYCGTHCHAYLYECMSCDLHHYVQTQHSEYLYREDCVVQRVQTELWAALAHLHGLSIVHRDMHSRNVLVRTAAVDYHDKATSSQSGVSAPSQVVAAVRLADFGLACFCDGATGRIPKCTLPCAAEHATPPEFHFAAGLQWNEIPQVPQVARRPACCRDAVSHAIDVWQLGAVLAEMVSGRPVFQADKHDGKFPSAVAVLVFHLGPVPQDLVPRLGWSVPAKWRVAHESSCVTSKLYRGWVLHTPFIAECLRYAPAGRPHPRQ